MIQQKLLQKHKARRGQKYSHYRKLKNLLILKVKDAVTSPTQTGYIRLLRKENQEIFELLDQMDFFKFHCTNNGHSCYLHQINLYLKEGWKKYKNMEYCKIGELEVHHYDNDVNNNNWDNLVYVTPYDNKKLSHMVRYSKRYYGNVINTLSIGADEFSKVAFHTIKCTAAAAHKKLEQAERLCAQFPYAQPFNLFAFHDPMYSPYRYN